MKKNNYTAVAPPGKIRSWKLLMSFLVLLFAVGITKAQSISTYSFSQTNAVYTPLTSPTSIFSGTTDDAISAAITLPFSFNYNGSPFTTLKVNSNGTVYMGSAFTSGTNYSPISSTVNR